jgi:membrane protease YdiL (CAAX protease family)
MKVSAFLRKHPVLGYFVLAFAISWSGALMVAAPSMVGGTSLPQITGLLMFAVMLLGPSVGGVTMTSLLEGRKGLQSLFHRIRTVHVGGRWYAALLIPPTLVLVTLFALETLVANVFTPNHFYLGILFGVPAGFLEEIGWTGYALPALLYRMNAFKAAIVMGAIWSIWHLPVINFLGAAAPHRGHWPWFFLAFALVMTAMRVLMTWLYLHSGSVLLAQLMHMSSTGALVVFSPAVTPPQEAGWYVLYGCLLWLLVVSLALICGGDLGHRKSTGEADHLVPSALLS